eukprot:TRINITY_DN1055_c0_g4_i1.p1 TRINITY_DN1055_c0_g4~~TRINITY_DN1055_c0_g4_i1.p1  ORF type:complete len:523 (-),score=23.02 TRINITY_DN1055_c0_g4_i1:74-1642(-)
MTLRQKGIISQGERTKKNARFCRSCGKISHHKQRKRCSACGYAEVTLRRCTQIASMAQNRRQLEQEGNPKEDHRHRQNEIPQEHPQKVCFCVYSSKRLKSDIEGFSQPKEVKQTSATGLASPDPTVLQSLATTYGTPLYIVDHKMIRSQCNELNKCFPYLNVFYAVKCNPVKEVVRTIFKQGYGFDVASTGEFRLVEEIISELSEEAKAEFIKNKIIYAHSAKPAKSLQELAKYGLMTTYDNIEEVSKIKKYAPNMRLLLRVSTVNPYSLINLSAKFGCLYEEAMSLIEAAIAQGLAVEGISFHVGSQCKNPQAFKEAIIRVIDIFEKAAAKGIILKKLDIGGGFPIKYEENRVASLEEYARAITPLLKRLPSWVQYYAEPGRFLVGDSGTLITKVVGKSNQAGKQRIYIDDGLYGCLSCYLMDIKRPLFPLTKQGETKTTIVFGPTCDCLDCLGEVELPEMDIDDLFYSPSIGAYSICAATRFNGFEPASIYHLRIDEDQGLVQPNTGQQLIALYFVVSFM